MRKWLLVVAVGVGLVLVALSVAVVASGLLSERRIDAAARATPEVGPAQIAMGGWPASMELGMEVNPSTVRALLDTSDVVLVDVRRLGEYEAGHIPGAVLVPLDELPERASEVPQDKGVMLVCRSGNRSAEAAQLLTDLGYDNVHSIRGGMRAWTRAGYPSEP